MEVTNIWNDAFQYIFGTHFIVMALFVIGVMEAVKTKIKFSPKWESTLMPYIALLVSFLAVGIVHLNDLANIKEWILYALVQAFFIDIFYTYMGKAVIKVIPFIWSIILNKFIQNKTDASNK